MRRYFINFLSAIAVLLSLNGTAQSPTPLIIEFDTTRTFQTINNFSASDAWWAQFAGNWPEVKKDSIADWLFSLDTLPNGDPKGIGLSMWRFNIGAGSAEQGLKSGIPDEWRRTPAFSNNASKKLEGQIWFLKAARQRGVHSFLGFFNSPPVQFTNNGKAFATGGKCNIGSNRYKDFAEYTVNVIQGIRQSTGIDLDYISVVNEPQWDWSNGGQEGCPYTNADISGLVTQFNQVFQQRKISSRLLITESGHLQYLVKDDDKPNQGNQIKAFFQKDSPLYVGSLKSVANIIASHSYFTSSPYPQAVALRNDIRKRIDSCPGLEYWQSEYCILGDNAGEISGSKKDRGMNAALYVARTIHADLAEANAAAWQWWTAVSAYDYKDGLIYMDKNGSSGHIYDSKTLWAFGNYSRFVRPGMKRVQSIFPAISDVFVSTWYNSTSKEIVIVLVNTGNDKHLLSVGSKTNPQKIVTAYITNSEENMHKHKLRAKDLVLLPESIMTIVIK